MKKTVKIGNRQKLPTLKRISLKFVFVEIFNFGNPGNFYQSSWYTAQPETIAL